MARAVTKASAQRSFGPELFRFLTDLKANNDREWFAENKERYENDVRGPALDFVVDFAPHLESISPHFVADPRPSGGSLFRIHRDTRFSKDKSPYKPYTGIQFRHERAKDAHTPGLLPPPSARERLRGLRDLASGLADARGDPGGDRGRPEDLAARRRRASIWHGESLKRAPAGYEPEHPLIEDLKRKDFIAAVELTQKDVCAVGFVESFAGTSREAAPLVRFLCGALELPY